MKRMNNEKGMAFLTVLMGVFFAAVIGTGIFVTTLTVLRGGQYTQSTFSAVASNLTKVGGVVVGVTNPTTNVEKKTFRVQTVLSKYAIIAIDGDIEATGSANIISDPTSPAKGGLYADGDIELGGNAHVAADATATGAVTIGGSATIDGTVRQGYTPGLVFRTDEEIDAIALTYKTEAEVGGTYDGNYSVSGAETLGPLYITGDLRIGNKGQVTIGGTIYVGGQLQITGQGEIVAGVDGALVVEDGDVKITGQGRVAADDIPLIMAIDGDISVAGNTELAAVLYAPNGEVKWTGNANLYGGAVGLNVTISGSTITYPFTAEY